MLIEKLIKKSNINIINKRDRDISYDYINEKGRNESCRVRRENGRNVGEGNKRDIENCENGGVEV